MLDNALQSPVLVKRLMQRCAMRDAHIYLDIRRHQMQTLPVDLHQTGPIYSMHRRASTAIMATRPNLVKVSMFTTRKESVSETEFHRYWTERHSKVVSEWLQRHGVVRYSQVSAIVHRQTASVGGSLTTDSTTRHHGRRIRRRRILAFFQMQPTHHLTASWKCGC